MEETNTAENVSQGCKAGSACSDEKKLSTWRVLVLLVVGILAIFVVYSIRYYDINVEGYFGSFIGKHAVLIVRLNNGYGDDADAEQICNALKIGGYLELSADKRGAEFIRSIDEKFDVFGASDANGTYYIKPAILNWISSHGWKLQQVWRSDFNGINVEYIFVR